MGAWEAQQSDALRGSEDASPSLGAAVCQTVASFVGSWESSRVTSYGDPRRPSRPLRAAICETVASFVGSWEVQQSDVLEGSEEASPSLGGCDLRNCRHFRGLLGGPAEGRLTGTRIEASPSLGAAICETVATFVGSWEGQRRGDIWGPP